jgi:hypothetical protein
MVHYVNFPSRRDKFEWPVDGPSEFSWGPGLVPPGKENAPPNRGGMYRGKCQPVELTTHSPDLSVRTRRAKPQARRPASGLSRRAGGAVSRGQDGLVYPVPALAAERHTQRAFRRGLIEGDAEQLRGQGIGRGLG